MSRARNFKFFIPVKRKHNIYWLSELSEHFSRMRVCRESFEMLRIVDMSWPIGVFRDRLIGQLWERSR